MEHIVNPALFAWSQALGVVPVGGGGSNYGDEDFDYEGDGGYSDESGSSGSGDYLVVDRTQLYDGESCGPGLVSLTSSLYCSQSLYTPMDSLILVFFFFSSVHYIFSK
jgi:hypothetical protein